MKIIKYFTLAEPLLLEKISNVSALSKLDDKVNEAIKNGWQPLGGVAIADYYVAQAVVIYQHDDGI